MAAPTFVQGANNEAFTSSAPTISLTGVTAGNILVLGIVKSTTTSRTISSVSDGTHTWNSGVEAGWGAGTRAAAVYYVTSASSGNYTVTVTFSGSVGGCLWFKEFAPQVGATVSFDTSGSLIETTTVTDHYHDTTGITTSTDVIVCGVMALNGTGGTITDPSGFTRSDDGGTQFFFNYQGSAGGLTAEQATVNSTTARNHAAAILSLKAPAAGGATASVAKRLPLLGVA